MDPIDKPELSIIVVAYHGWEALNLCLQSIADNPPDRSFEVIVVDSDASRRTKDAAYEVGASFKKFHYVGFNFNTGFPKGVNAGLKRATGTFILILNYDIVVAKGSIEAMTLYISEHPDVGLLGPQLKNFNMNWQQSLFRFYTIATILARRTFFSRFRFFKKTLNNFTMAGIDRDRLQTPDWLMGSALMTTAEALAKVGAMDERFFMYFEDVDWARRFWHNGYIVLYFPRAVMYHYHGQGSRTGGGLLDIIVNIRTRWHVLSALKFFWKYRNLKVARNNTR